MFRSVFVTATLISMGSLVSFAAMAEPEVGGVVTLEKGLEKNLSKTGTLFIIAKKAGAPPMGAPPVAVLRIQSPKFPQDFSLTAKNLMMPGTPFEGPFDISARYSPTGDALDKSGPEGKDPKNSSIPLGKKDLKIELKVKKDSPH